MSQTCAGRFEKKIAKSENATNKSETRYLLIPRASCTLGVSRCAPGYMWALKNFSMHKLFSGARAYSPYVTYKFHMRHKSRVLHGHIQRKSDARRVRYIHVPISQGLGSYVRGTLL